MTQKPTAENAPESGPGPGIDDKLARLERIIRSMGQDSVELLRRLQEIEKTIQGSEEHYAGSLRELESRVRDELQWQIHKGCLLAVMPGLDDLDLVIIHGRGRAGGSVEEDSVLEALLLVRQKISDGLRTFGLEEIRIEPGSTIFDPAVHQGADSDLPSGIVPDLDVPRGTILLQRRTGYRLKGRVIRPAQVIVKT
jgi:molecular chaperone GrpE (heat shock protein)